MNSPDTRSHVSDPKGVKRVKGLMLGRLIILTCLLAITFLFQVSEKKYFFFFLTDAFYYYIGLFYLATILYALFLNRMKDLNQLLSFQIFVDHLLIAGLIYFTGGRESIFPMVYFFAIIESTLFFSRKGAFFSASFSTVLYALILLLQFSQWINPVGSSHSYEASPIFYSLFIYMTSFFIVASLSGLIAEELEKKKIELTQKQVDYDQLETFNRNVIQSLDSGLLTVNLQGKINFLNRTAERILGLDGVSTQGASIYDLFPTLNRIADESVRTVSDSLSEYQRYETQFINPEGRKIYLGFSVSPLPAPDGSLLGRTLIFQDITRFKEMEEQVKRLDKMAAINQLAAGMAHEIRNPLTSLSGSIQVLKSELALESHQGRLMDIILRESERLNALITDFLLFAQPPKTNKGLWNIKSILEETIELFTHSQDYSEGIRVRYPQPLEDIRMLVDPDQMKQVFWNLILNAVQAMGDTGELTVGLEKRMDGMDPHRPNEWVKISISDSGKGIVSHEKDKIFEPFYTTKDGGTGLGLSIVHKIIENHNGLIRVESEVGRGSTFTILLPTQP
ncbi:MAG TPA: ATP-binding protein [Thermodesulfobacteriota bacterium]|nr:ATP-binding protein [Thermodesulfobacteriota bacterium]